MEGRIEAENGKEESRRQNMIAAKKMDGIEGCKSNLRNFNIYRHQLREVRKTRRFLNIGKKFFL